MRERPILFSGPMVRAILEGRKTQTRRVVKLSHIPAGTRTLRWENQSAKELLHVARCPYGEPGDRLWVRESLWHDDGMSAMQPTSIKYAADVIDPRPDQFFPVENWRKVPSIHMPRWASRITLEVKAVRVERVEDISHADAIAEGIIEWSARPGAKKHYGVTVADVWEGTATEAFARLWNSINGNTHPWASNPWVWVVEFERVKAGQRGTG